MFIFLCILISFCSKFIMFLPSGSNLHKINVPLWIFTRIDKSMTYQSPVKGLFPSELLGVFHHIPSGIFIRCKQSGIFQKLWKSRAKNSFFLYQTTVNSCWCAHATCVTGILCNGVDFYQLYTAVRSIFIPWPLEDMERERQEYLSAEELRNRLYHNLRDRGLFDSIKVKAPYIHNQLFCVWKLPETKCILTWNMFTPVS